MADQPQQELTLTPDEISLWWGRIEAARTRRKRESEKWKKLLLGFLPPQVGNPNDSLHSNIHFRDTYLKMSEIYAQMPELHLTPLEPLNQLRDPNGQPFMDAQGKPMDGEALAAHLISIKRAVLQKMLGRDHANSDHAFYESLFDIFATSGIGPTKICYEADLQPTEIEIPGAPVPVPGSMLGLSMMPGPVQKQTVDIPVYERWRWFHFSPEKLLQPHDWHSTDFDEAPWLGMEFVQPLTTAIRRKYKLPDGFMPNASRDELILTTGGQENDIGSSELLKGVEVWLRASVYDPNVAHSQLFYVLVLIEGLKDQVGEYRASPYQTLGQDGRLTADSMLGNPIHPFTLRVQSDTAWPPSDAAFTDPLVRMEDTWLSQDIKMRDANLPRFVHSDTITEAIDKLKQADAGQGVGIPATELAMGMEKLIAPLPHLEASPSDVQGRSAIKHAREETLGLSANQAGAYSAHRISATEAATVQANVSVRLKSEQNAFMSRILAGIRKFDSLLQRYATDRDYVQIVGPDGQRSLAMWNQHVIAGRYAYDAYPDSQLTMDQATRIKRVLDYVNFMAKSPYMNQAELARVVTLAFGFDPSRMVKIPDPPPPDKPALSLALKAADLAIPEARSILIQCGFKLDPMPSPQLTLAAAAEAAKNQPHGGSADRAETLSQHHGELTGALPGPHPPPPIAPTQATPTAPVNPLMSRVQ